MKLSVREAASVLNVSETKVYRWVDNEEIPFVMIHHHPMFHRLELLEWAMEMELPIRVDLYEGDTDLPFATALERGGGHTLGQQLDDIAEDLPLTNVDREIVRALLRSREPEMFVNRASDWTAIPKARSPIICPDVPPAVVLGWLRRRAIVLNNCPTTSVFLIIAPTITTHLQLLSRLSLALHDSEFCDAVRNQEGFDDVVAEARRWESTPAGPTS